MPEGIIQGKCVLARNNVEFEITELELVGSYFTTILHTEIPNKIINKTKKTM